MRKYTVGFLHPNLKAVAEEHRDAAHRFLSAILDDPLNSHRVYDHYNEHRYSLVRLEAGLLLLFCFQFDPKELTVEFFFVGTLRCDHDASYFDIHAQVQRIAQAAGSAAARQKQH
jgi:hypothetical protein